MKKLFNTNQPIITSLLETDTYKIRMLYFVWTFFPELKSKFAFTNRTTAVRLTEEIDLGQLREELEAVTTLRFRPEEIAFLRKQENYPEEFWQFLAQLELSDITVEKEKNGQLVIETAEDYQVKTTLWELIVLPIVNELYARQVLKQAQISEREVIKAGEERLRAKAEMLRETGVKALQFGLRRRLSGWWERRMTEMSLDLMPGVLVAVSNMLLARELGVPYGGTNAHELSMMLNALRWNQGSEAAWQSQYEVFEKWFQLFPKEQRVILPDTFGSKQFLDNILKELAREAMGFRQDSGNPIEFGYWVLEMWQRFGINPLERTLLFSDGLKPEKMLRLYQKFNQLTKVLFGWGTNFSNDTGFVKPLSIVMKLVRAGGNDAVKLSDNLAKAIGQPLAIAFNKKLFGYEVAFTEECVY